MPPKDSIKITLEQLDLIRPKIGHYTNNVIAAELHISPSALDKYEALGREIDAKLQALDYNDVDIKSEIDKLSNRELICYRFYVFLCEGRAASEKESTDVIKAMHKSDVDNVKLKAAEYNLERVNSKEWGLRGKQATTNITANFNVLQARDGAQELTDWNAKAIAIARELLPDSATPAEVKAAADKVKRRLISNAEDADYTVVQDTDVQVRELTEGTDSGNGE